MMKILVCGGRNYSDFESMDEVLSGYRKDEFLIIQGGANGADALAKKWAIKNYINYVEVPALWKAHGVAAGPIRNSIMADLEPDLCLAFPGGTGTEDMVKKCKARGIKVLTTH